MRCGRLIWKGILTMNLTNTKISTKYNGFPTFAVKNGWNFYPAYKNKIPVAKLLPLKNDGKPGWKMLQKRKLTDAEIQNYKNNKSMAEQWCMVAGHLSGIVVLDFDGEKGKKTLDDLKLNPHVQTGSGGFHVYLKHPGWYVQTLNQGNNIGIRQYYPGLDIRGDGGTATISGYNKLGEYKWLVDPETLEPYEVSILPELLQNIMSGKKKKQVKSSIVPSMKTTSNNVDEILKQALKEAENGGRNNAGFIFACKLRDLGYSEEEVIKTGEMFVDACPVENTKGEVENYTIDEFRASVEQAFHNKPKKTKYLHTDLGNAERFIDENYDDVRYSENVGWLVWNGQKWESHAKHLANQKAHQTVKKMLKNSVNIDDEDKKQKEVKWALTSQKANRISAMLEMAKHHLHIKTGEMDNDHFLFNVQNGTVDLRTGELKPHIKNNYITKISPVVYDAEADCPLFKKFISRIFNNNSDLIEFVKRAMGYSLTGGIGEKCLFFLHGNSGDNGKSTLIEIFMNILNGYGIKTPTETLMYKKHDNGASNDIARFRGARVVVCQEIEDGQRLKEAKIKDLTGGDTISARFLFKELFQFKPTHKLWMYGNYKPQIKGNDDAIWRRIKLIPFNVQIPKDEQDPDLKKKLIKESSGILNWLIEGCLKWQKNGLNDPNVITNATNNYRGDMDTLGKFIEDALVFDPALKLKSSELYEVYSNYILNCGEKPVSQKRFVEMMKRRGYESTRKSDGKFYLGIGKV